MDTRQIKAANPIETVAARYATLHRAGANYKMLCPFHDDHHPSLSLHVAGQYFKCHACGAGGDVIGLVMGLEKCSFAEAVKKLGGDSCQHDTTNNCATKSTPSPLERGQGVCHSHPEKLSTEQQAFLRSLLPAASGHSELSPTWIDFGVGVAPAFVPDAFRAMRSRLIFPIRDETGRLTGFGARRIDGKDGAPSDSSPKYINTANNGLFDKSRTLYGIDRAAGAIREAGFVFVVEGYKDVLAMHAAGYRPATGTDDGDRRYAVCRQRLQGYAAFPGAPPCRGVVGLAGGVTGAGRFPPLAGCRPLPSATRPRGSTGRNVRRGDPSCARNDTPDPPHRILRRKSHQRSPYPAQPSFPDAARSPPIPSPLPPPPLPPPLRPHPRSGTNAGGGGKMVLKVFPSPAKNSFRICFSVKYIVTL